MVAFGDLVGCSFIDVGGTRPQHHDVNTTLQQHAANFAIALHIATDLVLPKLTIRCRKTATAAVVAMPKAAVHKNDQPEASDVDVRLAGQIAEVKPVANPTLR